MGLLAAVISCVLVSAAPDPCAPGPPQPLPLPVERFALSYERSGGLAAMPQKLVVKPGRQATVTVLGSDGRPRSSEFRLGFKQVKKLSAAVNSAVLREVHPSFQPTCADCFTYTVAYRNEEASVEEIDVPNRMRPLINQAEALIAAHLPFH